MKIPRWLWVKKYFDTGYNVLGYAKFIVLGVGLSGDRTFTIIFGSIYAVVCLVVGIVWVKKGYADAENEINNILNPFQREMRNVIKNGKH